MHENAAEHRWLSSRLEPAKLLIVAVVPVVIVLTLSLLAGSQRDGPLLFPALPLRSGTVCARCSYTTALDGRACCRVLLPPVLARLPLLLCATLPVLVLVLVLLLVLLVFAWATWRVSLSTYQVERHEAGRLVPVLPRAALELLPRASRVEWATSIGAALPSSSRMNPLSEYEGGGGDGCCVSRRSVRLSCVRCSAGAPSVLCRLLFCGRLLCCRSHCHGTAGTGADDVLDGCGAVSTSVSVSVSGGGGGGGGSGRVL